MYGKQYFCPFCKSEFYILLESCYQCKQKIPGELVSKIAFVVSLQKNVEQSKLEGIVDDDLFVSIVNACSVKERSLQNELQEWIQLQKKQTEELEQNLEKKKLPEALSPIPPAKVLESISEVDESTSLSKNNAIEVHEKTSSETAVTFNPSSPLNNKEGVDTDEVVTFEPSPVQDKKQEESKVVDTMITFDPLSSSKKEDAKTIPDEVSLQTKKQEEIEVINTMVTFDPLSSSKKEDVKTKPDEVVTLDPSSLFSKENIVEIRDDSKAQSQQNQVAKKVVVHKFAPPLSSPVKQTFLKKQTKEMPMVPKKKPTAIHSTFHKPKVKERKPSILITYLLHPAVKENILLFIGIFLIMVGEVFVVSNSWSGFSDTMQFLSIYALLFSSALLFSFIGSFVARRLEVRSGGTILFFIAMMLMPLTFIPLTKLNSILSAIIVSITLIIYGFMGRNIARFFHNTLPKLVYIYFLPLCIVHLSIPVIKEYHWLWFFICYGTAAFVIFGLRKFIFHHQDTEANPITAGSILLWSGILGIGWAEFALHTHYALATQGYVLTASQYAPILAMIAVVLARIDRLVLKSIEPTSVVSIIAISTVTLAMTVSTGSRYMILLTAIISLTFFIGYTQRFRRYYFFVASLILSVAVYFLLPLPIKQTLAELRAQISSGLGYAQGRLPFSFYGITFLPYMIALCWLGRFIKRWEPKFMRYLQGWFVMLSIGILALVKFGGTDVRAPLATLPIYGIGYLLAVIVLEMPFLYYLGFASLSIWAYDLTVFMGLPPQERMGVMVGIAILWYILALIKFFHDNVRKALIDISFASAGAVIVLGVIFLSFPPPTLLYGIAMLLASGILVLAVFVYAARWIWVPSFLMVWLSISLLCYYDSSQNFLVALLYASAIWSYGAVLIALVIPYLQRKNLTFWLPIRSGIKTLDDKSLLQPLLFLLPLPIITVCFCALNLWASPKYETLYALLAVSFLPLLMPKMLGIHPKFSNLALFPFFMSVIYNFVYAPKLATWPTLIASVLFIMIAFWLYLRIEIILGLFGIFITLQSTFIYYHITVPNQCILIAIVGILLLGCQKLTMRDMRKPFGVIFEAGSIIYGSYVLLLWMLQVIPNKIFDTTYLPVSLLCGTLAFLHFTVRRKEFFIAITFTCWSASISLITEFLFPFHFEIQAISFALWGIVLWSLHFVINGYWQNKQFPPHLLHKYPIFAFAIAYLLATYFSIGKGVIDVASTITLLLCSLYCFVLAFEWKRSFFVYLCAIILNQSLMSLYLLSRTMLHVYEWPLAESIICLLLFLLGALLEKKSTLAKASHAMYHFTVLAVFFTLTYVALWRLKYAFASSGIPVFTIYMGVCLLSAMILYLCYYKLNWKALPYLVLAAIWLCAIYIMDDYGGLPIYYVLCTSMISLCYAVIHILSPSFRPAALYSSMGFAFIGIASLPYFYSSTSIIDHHVIFIVLIGAMIHALYCFVITRFSAWAYLGLIYMSVAFSPSWSLKIMHVSIYYQPIVFMILVAIFLAGAWFLRNRDYKISLNNVYFYGNGIEFSQVLRNSAGILLSGWLLIATCIWFVAHISSHGQYLNAQYFITEYNGVLQLSLVVGLTFAFTLSFMQKGILRNWHESTAILIGALLLFMHTPLSQIFNQSISIYLVNFDGAAYALICVLLGLYLKRESYSFWGIVFGVLSLIGVPFSYGELSSVCAVLMLAFDLLIIRFTHPRWKSPILYYGMFALGLGLLGGYFAQKGAISQYLEMAPLLGSLLALLFCFISLKTKSQRTEFYQELARYASWISLVLGLSLGYLTANPAPLHHLIILLLCIIIQIPVLSYIGKFETTKISHYFMLFMGAAFYIVLRTRTPILNILEGYDHAAFVLLFTILPSLGALWLRNKNNQILISNFSLICLVIAFLNQLNNLHAFHYVATYFGIAAILIMIRASYVYENESSEKKFPREQTKLDIAPWFALASIIFSFYLYSQEGQSVHQIIALNAAFVAIFGFLYFARYSDKISLYIGYIFFIVSGYFLFVLDYLRLGWHPFYLIICVNIVLLTGFSSRDYTWRNFTLFSVLIRRVATSFSIFILGLIMIVSAMCCLQLLINVNRSYISTIVGQDMLIILATGIATIFTSIHITRYDKEAITDLLLPATIFLTVGLTAPIGHIISGIEWTIYCPPSIDWALLGIGLCIYNKYAQIKSYTIASFLSMSFAFIGNGYSIHESFTFITLFLTSVNVLFFYADAKDIRQKQRFYHLYTINILLAVYFLIFYLLPKTGKPVSLVFPLLASVTSALAMLFLVISSILEKKYSKLKEWSLRESITQTNILFSGIALLFLTAAVLMITRTTANVTLASYDMHVALCIFSILLLIVESLVLAQRTDKKYYYYQFQLLIVGAFYLIRYKASWLDFLATYEPHVLIIFAISFFQVGSSLEGRNKDVATTFFYTSYALPIMTLFYNPWQLEMAGSSLFILGTTHFGLIYLMRRIRTALYTSLALLDLALYQVWGSMNIVDPQFYGIPLGITLIVLAELTRKEIHKNRLSLLRSIGLLCIYGSSAMQVLMQFNQPIYALYLGALAFIGIIIGLFIKNNLYILISASFLVANVLLYIIKFGMEKGILPGMLLVIAGSAILGTYIYFQRQAIKKKV